MLRSLALTCALTLASCAQTQNTTTVSPDGSLTQKAPLTDNQKAARAVGTAAGVYIAYVAIGFSMFLASVTD